MSNRVKIVGYAKKEFFTNGIEYRNFSPDLVGNQYTSDEGTAIFTSGNFNISTNLDGKVNKEFVTNNYSDFMNLCTLNIDGDLESILTKYSKNAKLNLDYTDVLTYAFFGSLREYIRVSLENIIIKWPASLYIREVKATDPLVSGDTVLNYVYDSVTNLATFDVSTDRIENTFDINFLSGGTIENTFNESNTLRNLILNYGNYVISNTYGDFTVTNFSGSTGLTASSVKVITEGDSFPNFGSENINYHIKPNSIKFEDFFFKLNEFENNLLNRLTIPEYTSKFKVYKETNSGAIVETYNESTWPISDGYNIEFNSIDYVNYVNNLISIADESDNLKSNLMVRFLVSTSISEFDSVPDIDGSYYNTNGQKMTSALKIYGREFDEIKNYSDGISFAHTVTYDKKNNTPDAVLKNLSRVLGWQLTSSISQIDVLSNFLSLNSTYYDGYSRGYTDAEAEIELWRRIILNTPWLWKSKGTRKAIEFLFKFIGAPDGLVTFNEHLYVADAPVDSDLVITMMEYFNDTNDISGLNLDSDGYPYVLPDTPEMYFQKAGLWYRQTGGPNPDIDILEGNNPHIGPYDGGQAYIDQFRDCLVPNFSGGTSVDVNTEAEINLFTNYAFGTFDECCDSDILVEAITNHDFDGILTTNINQIYANNPVTESGCTITNSWTLTASLTGETFYENAFFVGATAPTESDYVTELYNLSGTTNLSGATFTYNSNDSIFTISLDNEDCDSDLLGIYFNLELCVDSTYDCIDETVTGLTSFIVSLKLDDACNPVQPRPLTETYYHSGSNALPEIGDTVYGSDGITPAYHPSGFTTFMGGDWALSINWLETDINGVMLAHVCSPSLCNITVGNELIGGVETFWIDGVSEFRVATVMYRIYDIVGGEVGAFINGHLINSVTPTYDDVLNISPDGGTIYDIELPVGILIEEGVISFRVSMQIIYMDGECINGPSETIINYTL
jgi:hypothetical protein